MDETVEIPFDNPREQAILLLAAAEDLELDPGVVLTTEGAFVVPAAVAEKAYPKKRPAKKSSAKKDEEDR
jgi:hypothetical protein